MSDTNHKWDEVVVNYDDDEVWDREAPIEGVYLGMKDNVGPNESKMYTIRTSDDDVKVWGSTVLDDRLANVPIGSYIKIQYEGKKKSKRGNSFHDFKVFIDTDYKKSDDDIDTSEIPF